MDAAIERPWPHLNLLTKPGTGIGCARVGTLWGDRKNTQISARFVGSGFIWRTACTANGEKTSMSGIGHT